jgi:hypothetical protein
MNTLPELLSPGHLGSYRVVSAPRSAMRLLLELAARLALASSVRVLDCGNCFNVYTVAQVLHQHTMDTTEALQRIRVSRAFTCYQVTTLLESASQDATPTLVLDLLATFLDESVSLGERRRLLDRNIAALRRLSRQGGVLVSIHPKGGAQESSTGGLFAALEEAAGGVWRLEAPAPASLLRLF